MKLHIPTEQFGFVEVELGGDDALVAVDIYRRASSYARGESGNGIPAKRFNEIYDTYRLEQKMEDGGDFWGDLSYIQQVELQALKRSFARE